MSDASEQDRIELDVKDFGPILEAKIDLRPLTVFVGPSNTGKSYLAILIYALHRCFGGDAGPDHWRASESSLILPDGEAKQRLDGAIKSLLKSSAWALLMSANQPDHERVVLPPPILDEVRSLFDARGCHLSHEISRCFGIDEARVLSRKESGDGAHVAIRNRLSDGSVSSEHGLRLGKRGTEFKGRGPQNLSISGKELKNILDVFFRRLGKDEFTMFLDGDDDSDFFIRTVVELLEKTTRNRLVGALSVPAFYLPADRTGIMHAHGPMISGVIGNASVKVSPRAARTLMLPGVLADFLQQIIEVDRMGSADDHPLPEIGAGIENAILGGSVFVERSDLIGFPQFMYRPDGWRKALRLTNASSMVSELAPVVLYLRYLVRPGDVLIIEEPESSLHPAMQVELIRQIAAMVRAGVRVILTTHSEWVLEELSNIVLASSLPEARRNGIGGGEFALRPEDVGAWWFQQKKRPRGSVVEEIHPEKSELYSSAFTKVSASTYNDWVRISGRLGEGE